MSKLTKKELATWVITGDPYTRMIPPPLSTLYERIIQALTIQEEDNPDLGKTDDRYPGAEEA